MNLKVEFTKEQNEGYRAGIQDALDYIYKRKDFGIGVSIDKYIEYLKNQQTVSKLGD